MRRGLASKFIFNKRDNVSKKIPLIIDVDTGIDDAFGLLYALADPNVRLLGVSTVAGNVDLVRATENTRAVLALGGRIDIPVWPGAAAPLLKSARDASEIHGKSGLGDAELEIPPPPAEPPAHAVDAILAAAKAHKGELILVATGPLTNIAVALLRDPDLVRKMKRFVLMGGAFFEGGNVTPTAEFNIWHDPEAARIVFRAFGALGAAPLIAVGLDVTRKTLLLPADIEALRPRLAGLPRGEQLVKFLADASRHYLELMRSWGRAEAVVIHDPLAVAVALDPSFVTLAPAAVDVEILGELTRGMTVVHNRADLAPRPNAQVAVGVAAPRFIAAYLEAMVRLAAA